MSAYQLFDELHCYNYACMDDLYQEKQSTMCDYRMEPLTTHMRCFRDPVLEQKLRTDTINSRIYTPMDCRIVAERPAGATSNKSVGTSSASALVFNQATKSRTPMN